MSEKRTFSDRFLTVLLHAAFLISGIATILIGPVLPILANRFTLDDLTVGNFFPVQFVGSLTGTFASNWFARKGKLVPASAIGCVLMAIGVALMNGESYGAVMLAFVVNGLGIGLTLPAINVLILERSGEKAAASLGILNFFWGIGAIFTKPLVDLTTSGTSLLLTSIIISAPLVIIGTLLLLIKGRAEGKIVKTTAAADLTPIWSVPLAWMIAIFNFIHVGFESAMGGWITTYSERIDNVGTSFHLLTPTLLYFLFFVAGRGAAPVIFRFLNENQVILGGLLVILGGLAIMLTAHDTLMLSIGASVAGFGTSCIFPTNVARFSKLFGPQAMRRATPFFVLGTLGSTATTWLIGFLSTRSGSLRSGMMVLVCSIVSLIALQVVLAVKTAGRFSQSRDQV